MSFPMNDALIANNFTIGDSITGVSASGLLALRRLPFPLLVGLLISRLITRLIE